MKKLLEYYRAANKHRRNWFHWKLRVSIIALLTIALLLVYYYLDSNYYCLVEAGQCHGLQGAFLSELLFNWFVLGAFFGFAVFAIAMEGEFILGLRKIVKALEKDAEEVEDLEKKLEKEGERRGSRAKPRKRR